MARPATSGDDARALPLVLAAATLATVAFQFAFYFRETTYYGVGLNYLLNFDAVPGTAYLGPFVFRSAFYPPFYYLFLYALHQVFGFHYLPYVAANALLPVGGAFYAEATARRLAGREAGALAFCAFLLFPAQAAFTASLVIEAPLLLFVPAFLYHALASEQFQYRGHALAAGAFFALGMLTKWSFFAYAAVPALFLIATVFRDPATLARRRVQRVQAVNLLLAAGLAIALAAPWYLGPFNLAFFRASAGNDPTFPVYSRWANLQFNLTLLAEFAGRPTLAALGLLALAATLLDGPAVLGWAALLVGAPLAFFVLPGHLEDRYLWPVFPGLALAAGIAWRGVRRRAPAWARQAALVALVAVFAATSWRAFVAYRGDPEPRIADKNYTHGSPLWERADSGRVLRAVADALSEARPPDRPVTVAPHPFMTDPHLSSTQLRYHRLRDPALARLAVMGVTFYRYHDVIAEARAGRLDVLLVDADRWAHYAAPDFDPADDAIRHVLDRPYVDQSSGKVYPRLDLDGFRDDMRFLAARYHRVRTLRLPKATVWVLVSRAYEERYGPVAER